MKQKKPYPYNKSPIHKDGSTTTFIVHISEISYGYVKNVNDYLKIGDSIYAEVVEVSDKDNQLKLSIKDIDYKKDGTKLKRMAETKNGFTPLKDNLEIWINKKIKEITDKM